MTEEQKKRLSKEINDLREKLHKLGDFMRTKEFYKLDRPNKSELYKQKHAMLTYLEILGVRAELNDVNFMEEE